MDIFGFGMLADFVVLALGWAMLQVAMFLWPDLDAYKMDRKT